VEVGAGQGPFLRLLAETGKGRIASAAGFDPAWRGGDGAAWPSISMYRALYTPGTALRFNTLPDTIVTRHTIEHVADPVGFLHSLRRAAGNPNVRIFVETPCVDWIIRAGQVHDLVYEHCSLFTAKSLAWALEQTDFVPAAVEHVYDGQYLWGEAGFGDGAQQEKRNNLGAIDFDSWAQKKQEFIGRWLSIVVGAAGRGPLYLWGAGAKGVGFALLIDPLGEMITGVIDNNPGKQNNYLPITAVPVMAPREMAPAATVILLNPIYAPEIKAQIARMERNVDLYVLD
jgi:hypothetical protein